MCGRGALRHLGHRAHALGDARQTVRLQRTPSFFGQIFGRAQRHNRKLCRTARRAYCRRLRLLFSDGQRGGGAPSEQILRRRPQSRRYKRGAKAQRRVCSLYSVRAVRRLRCGEIPQSHNRGNGRRSGVCGERYARPFGACRKRCRFKRRADCLRHRQKNFGMRFRRRGGRTYFFAHTRGGALGQAGRLSALYDKGDKRNSRLGQKYRARLLRRRLPGQTCARGEKEGRFQGRDDMRLRHGLSQRACGGLLRRGTFGHTRPRRNGGRIPLQKDGDGRGNAVYSRQSERRNCRYGRGRPRGKGGGGVCYSGHQRRVFRNHGNCRRGCARARRYGDMRCRNQELLRPGCRALAHIRGAQRRQNL